SLESFPTAKPASTNTPPRPAASTAKPRKLTWKETRELEGMEGQILATEEEIARIEALFAEPDFHRQHGTKTEELVATLAATKETLAQLYARWEELEAVKAAAGAA
ncbi:MAG TPA: ABC transporter ATP-binding protein, partial [Verrucomicrobiae bacterium]|nr:ABC transporter ATP-binding protein [Verrucomicrobiae bacterium]